MNLSPHPRFRFYGSPDIYVATMAAALTGRIRRGDRDIVELQTQVAGIVGAGHALCMPQARVGIYLALCSLIQPGQKVILSPYTHYDVINMVLCSGGQPVFADVEADSCNICANDIAGLIDSETGAVIATHLYGQACDIERIAETCSAAGIALIEDAAQCFGGRVNGRHVGTFGDVGVFSFHLVKNVNTFYGGMVITNKPDLRDRMAAIMARFPYESPGRLLRRAAYSLGVDAATAPPVFQLLTSWLSRLDYLFDVNVVGKLVQVAEPECYGEFPRRYKRRMTPLQARLAMPQIGDIDDLCKIRVECAKQYRSGLENLSGIVLPPQSDDGSHIYLFYPIRVTERDRLVRQMMRAGRDLHVQTATNAADLPCFSDYARDCPNARAAVEEVLLLPTYPAYPEVEVQKNIGVIRKFFDQAGDK